MGDSVKDMNFSTSPFELNRRTRVKNTIKPCGDRILVKQDDAEDKSKGGILLPNQKPPGKGKVLAVGKDVEEIKDGDIVLFQKYEATPLEIEGASLVVVREEHVLVCITN